MHPFECTCRGRSQGAAREDWFAVFVSMTWRLVLARADAPSGYYLRI
jgi:hypothetical protein